MVKRILLLISILCLGSCFGLVNQRVIAQEAEIINNKMVLVEAGEKGGVEIDEDFYIGKYHVTQSEFEEIMGSNPSEFSSYSEGNPDNPVENVTWFEAIKYCNKLSKKEGLEKYYDIMAHGGILRNSEANGYRLPTKDEHEYAARGGKNGETTIYAGSDDLDEVAWHDNNTGGWEKGSTYPVGEKKPNELGLYDMNGNVYDWTDTSYQGSLYAIRGGGWFAIFYYTYEVGESFKKSAYVRDSVLGFRLARNP